jgi:ParB family chromosome partitioning protein
MSRQSVTHLPVDDLFAHPGNVRDDLGDLTDMASSIREHGILQPLTVTERPEGGHLVLAGHRRLAAARLAGLSRVPVVIRHDVAELDEHLVLMLVENTQRRDLNPMERAEAYDALRNAGLTLSEVARRTGTTPTTRPLCMTQVEHEKHGQHKGFQCRT